MKIVSYVAAFLFALTLTLPASAQLFYTNTLYPGVNASFNSTDEITDDTPFTGTQHVASFTFEYQNLTSGPVSATARFYGVDAATGGPGALVATVPISNLAPTTAAITTVSLDASQQFDWTAMPGIYLLQSVTGGFVSIQFSSAQCGWWEAAGTSENGFYDQTTGQFVSFQESNGSFYLQMSGSTAPVTLASVLESPFRVKGGVNAKAKVTLSGPAPTGGLVVSLFSSNPKIASLPATVTVLAGSTSATVVIKTTKVLKNTNLLIWGTLDGVTQTSSMVVTP